MPINLDVRILKVFEVFVEAFRKYPFSASHFCEDYPRPKKDDEDNIVELRIDGPYFNIKSKSETDVYFEVNLLATSLFNGKEPLLLRKILAQCAQFLLQDFTIPDVGCLELSKEDKVKTSYFGQADVNQPIFMGCVEAHYNLVMDG